MDNVLLKKNDEYIVTIVGYNSEGNGVARVNGFAVFIPYALKGEVWKIKILKVTNSAIFAKGLECMRSSADRVKPVCPDFYKCGGCDTQQMNYEEELRFKLGKVQDALTRIGNQSVIPDSIEPCAKVLRYRNKGIYNVSYFEGKTSFGFYKPRSHELVDIDSCFLQNDLSDKVAKCIIDFMNDNAIKPYNENDGTGTLRHIFVRNAIYTNEAVVCIISARGFGAFTDALLNKLIYECPELTGIVLCINKGRYNTVLDGEYHTLYGNPDITDYLGRFEFKISPQAFYQINPPQAEKLYSIAADYASRGSCESCLELYCGSGTISLFLSEKFRNVYASEIVPEAIENAKFNAENNKADNVTFIQGDAAETAGFAHDNGMKFDCVVVDPPRKGMSEDAIAAIADINPERIVYVSCNPSTLARDILRLNAFGFELKEAKCVDMFPRTCHVETLVLMSRA